jgi:hypothetical protein
MKTSARKTRGPVAVLPAGALARAGCPGPALILGTVAAAAGAWILAHAIRFEFRVPDAVARAMAATLPAVTGTYMLAFLVGSVYRIL